MAYCEIVNYKTFDMLALSIDNERHTTAILQATISNAMSMVNKNYSIENCFDVRNSHEYDYYH